MTAYDDVRSAPSCRLLKGDRSVWQTSVRGGSSVAQITFTEAVRGAALLVTPDLVRVHPELALVTSSEHIYNTQFCTAFVLPI